MVSLRISTRALMIRQLFLDDSRIKPSCSYMMIMLMLDSIVLIVFAALFQMVVSAVALAGTFWVSGSSDISI